MWWSWIQYLQPEERLPFQSLTGPISFTKLQRADQTIYLIGDLHVRQPPSHCTRQPALGVSDFLQLMAKMNPEVPIDMYVEITQDDYIANDRSPRRQELFQVNSDFDKCKTGKTKLSKRCDFPNVRYHWIDVREKLLLPLLSSFEGSPETFRAELRELRQMWPSFASTYNTKESFERHLNEDRAVQKQLAKLKDAQLRQLLEEDTRKCFNLQRYHEHIFSPAFAAEIDAYLKGPVKAPAFLRRKPLFRRFETFLYDDYLLKEACLLDVYVLGRMFKSDAKNVVMYAGDLHIQHISRVLRKLGFREVFTKKSRNQCIDISRLPLPLFPKPPNGASGLQGPN
jgi:hypothetical protein